MSKTSKFPGGGRIGDIASGGRTLKQGVYGSGYNDKANQSPKGSSGPKVSTSDVTHPGDDMGTSKLSSSNNVQTFMRTAKSRGPYNGPSFRSMSNSHKDMQRSDTSEISRFQNPSSGGSLSRGKGTGSGEL